MRLDENALAALAVLVTVAEAFDDPSESRAQIDEREAAATWGRSVLARFGIDP